MPSKDISSSSGDSANWCEIRLRYGSYYYLYDLRGPRYEGKERPYSAVLVELSPFCGNTLPRPAAVFYTVLYVRYALFRVTKVLGVSDYVDITALTQMPRRRAAVQWGPNSISAEGYFCRIRPFSTLPARSTAHVDRTNNC